MTVAGLEARVVAVDPRLDVSVLPAAQGLRGLGGVRFFPNESEMSLAISGTVGLPRRIGRGAPLDDGRIAERWWMA